MSMTMYREDRPVREPEDPRRAAMARRSLSRWALRLAVREWKQRVLIIALIAVASAATLLGIAVASATPGTPNAGTYGTAQTLVELPRHHPGPGPPSSPKIEKAYGTASVVYDAADHAPARPAAPTCAPRTRRRPTPRSLLALESGRYPSGPGQVAVTSGLARLYGLRIGSTWHVPAGAGAEAGRAFTVTGIVEDPSNLLDEFALVAPGQLSQPGRRADLPRHLDGLRRRVRGGRRRAEGRERHRAAARRRPGVPGDRGARRLGARPGLHRPGRHGRVHRHGAAQAARARHARLARRHRGRRPVRADHRRPRGRRGRRGPRRRGGGGRLVLVLPAPGDRHRAPHRPARPALAGGDHRPAARGRHVRRRRRVAGPRGQQGAGGRRRSPAGSSRRRWSPGRCGPASCFLRRRPVPAVHLRRLGRRRRQRQVPHPRRPGLLRDRLARCSRRSSWTGSPGWPGARRWPPGSRSATWNGTGHGRARRWRRSRSRSSSPRSRSSSRASGSTTRSTTPRRT